jgi:16S rRNA A1518/A1519 N6-dimethyltransferase RsmA/KsgA/DIM1 with predicted DNA glycosylase/AP lyase activity
MSKGSVDYNPKNWHNIQSPEEMDVSRCFEYDEDALFQLRKWLRLDEELPKTIVEVGCGSGYFTEKLIEMASWKREIVAIEPDEKNSFQRSDF